MSVRLFDMPQTKKMMDVRRNASMLPEGKRDFALEVRYGSFWVMVDWNETVESIGFCKSFRSGF